MTKSFLLITVLCVAVPPARAEQQDDYAEDVKPILKARCYSCHGALKQESGLRLDTGGFIRQGGESGPAVKAGDVANSLIVQRVTEKDESLRMPPEGEPLTAEQIERIKNWIARGARSPESEQPEDDPREHWAVKKPVRPPLVPAPFVG